MCYHMHVENQVASLVIDATDAELLEIDFRSVPDGPKAVKNRLHLDIKPVSRHQAAELDRLLALGARQVDVGQGTRSWHVLADPKVTSSACAVPDLPTRPIRRRSAASNRNVRNRADIHDRTAGARPQRQIRACRGRTAMYKHAGRATPPVERAA